MKRSLSIVTLEAVMLMALAPASPRAFGQRPAADPQASKAEDIPSISVEVEVVNVFFTVTDRQGRLITNLNKEDFTIEEEGQPQTIKYFSRQTDLPLTMGLLVDTSASQGALIDIERDASSQFFNQMLRLRKDQAFLISFDVNVDLLQDYTDSVRLLRSGLDKLRVNGGGISGGPMPGSSRPRGTLLYDAVYLAANDMLKNQVGRKTLVLITDGVDQGSQYDVKQAVASAQRSDAIIYSIDYEDRAFYFRGGYMIGGPNGGSVLKKLSEETGGRVFEVSKKRTLKSIYDEIQDELRSQYSLGYTPSRGGAGFRRIKITPKNRDLKVQARLGYYAKN